MRKPLLAVTVVLLALTGAVVAFAGVSAQKSRATAALCHSTTLSIKAPTSVAAGNTINLAAPGLPVAYAQGVQVGRPKLIQFAWNGVDTIFKDAGNGTGLRPLAAGVTACSLTYFNTNDVVIPPGALPGNLGSIRRIVVTLTAQSTGSQETRSFSLTSSVRPRNL